MKTLWLLIRRTVHEYGDDNCSHMAAAISYYVLFSIIPLAIFLISIFGLVVRDEERQQDIAAEIVSFLDVEEGDLVLKPNEDAIEALYDAGAVEEIREALEGFTVETTEELALAVQEGGSVIVAGRSLDADELDVSNDNVVIDTIQGVSDVSGALTIVGLVGMAWSASAMFGAIRKSLNIAWDTDVHRPVVQQKLVDLGMVLGLGTLLGLSIAGTTALRTLQTLSDDALGPLSTGTGFFWLVLPLFLPAVLSFSVFLLVYRYVPNVQTKVGDVWPGALLATVLFELLKNGFAFYIANFNNYAGAYGALGGILLFMLWAYLTANILLIGAELAAEYPRVLRGDYDEPETGKKGRPLRETVREGVRGLFIHQRDEVEVTDESTEAEGKD